MHTRQTAGICLGKLNSRHFPKKLLLARAADIGLSLVLAILLPYKFYFFSTGNFGMALLQRHDTSAPFVLAHRPETIEETAEMVSARGGMGIAVPVDHTIAEICFMIW